MIIRFPYNLGNIKIRGLTIFNLVFTTRKRIETAFVTIDALAVSEEIKRLQNTYNGLEVYYEVERRPVKTFKTGDNNFDNKPFG